MTNLESVTQFQRQPSGGNSTASVMRASTEFKSGDSISSRDAEVRDRCSVHARRLGHTRINLRIVPAKQAFGISYTPNAMTKMVKRLYGLCPPSTAPDTFLIHRTSIYHFEPSLWIRDLEIEIWRQCRSDRKTTRNLDCRDALSEATRTSPRPYFPYLSLVSNKVGAGEWRML